MNTIEIPQRNIVREVPECWDEMTSEQVCAIVQLFECYRRGAISEVDFYVRALYLLLGIRRRTTTIFLERVLLRKYSRRDEHVVLLCEQLLPFLVAENETGRTLTFDSVRNFLPSIRYRRRTLIGPADLLADLTFAEFRFACTEMSEYFSNGDRRALDRMIGCLYRPADRGGRRRQSFDPERLDEFARTVARLPLWQKKIILMWFANCVSHIQNKEVRIDGRAIEFSCLFDSKEDDRESGSLGWVSVLYALASDGVFGDAEKTDRAGLFDVLCLLYDNYHKNRRK